MSSGLFAIPFFFFVFHEPFFWCRPFLSIRVKGLFIRLSLWCSPRPCMSDYMDTTAPHKTQEETGQMLILSFSNVYRWSLHWTLQAPCAAPTYNTRFARSAIFCLIEPENYSSQLNDFHSVLSLELFIRLGNKLFLQRNICFYCIWVG